MQERPSVKRLVLSGLLVAAGVLLSGALSIPAFPLGVYSIKIGFGMLPVILAGILFGPIYGGMVGGLTDLLQALLFPRGAFVPWFTIAAVFFGLIPGLYFIKKQKPTLPRLLFAVGSGQVFGSVICNTLIMVFVYGLPLTVILPLRIVNQAIMIPLYAIILYWILPRLKGFNTLSKPKETPSLGSKDSKEQAE
ncbi:MAG TPA: folate family ECF transporter S component [Clostridia bacterium]|nr:folate family ECF transporter S component [Clostridia bacterium]